jgi:hypothetical protein
MVRFAGADGCFAFFFLFSGRVVGMLVLGFENHSNGRVTFSQLSSRWLICAGFKKPIRVVQLCFHLWCTLFNRAVKNDVEKAAVTSVTLSDFGPFSPLHLMRCGTLKNFERGPKWFIHQAS